MQALYQAAMNHQVRLKQHRAETTQDRNDSVRNDPRPKGPVTSVYSESGDVRICAFLKFTVNADF